MAGVECEVIPVALSGDGYREQLARYSPSMLVPVLIDGDLVIHDSLAIAEYLNEHSGGRLLPADSSARAMARSLLAELHSGFFQLRSTCPYTLEVVEPVVVSNAIQAELTRVTQIFSQATGEYMFDAPGAVDAFYAVLASRLSIYGVSLEGRAGEYQRALTDWSLFKSAWQQVSQWSVDGGCHQ
ncbi:glutathione S-transferase [Gynuella sunshinyii YC6258]|uniref:Glutathione S-transferase n=1 Tax=Gynuella sunshinyii YC6258 TaxID=1445510 RepID=A0A0C5VIY9_9GAMM|nr:glutathione S-transferase [Gynuella sunshinyii YC6258]